MREGLIARGYSEQSANIITGQYWTNGQTGTEAKTWLDVREIIDEHNEAPLLSFMAYGKQLAKLQRKAVQS